MIFHPTGGAILTRILVVTDFSELAKATIYYVMGLARQFKSTVMIVQIVDPHAAGAGGNTSSSLISSELRRERTEELRRIKSQISGAGIEAKVIYYEGSPPSTALKRLAKQRRADLIVISARSGGVVLDSSALQIIGAGLCPVLTVGPSIQSFEDRRISLHNIVYVTDYSPQALEGAIYVIALADGMNAHISVCRLEKQTNTKQVEKDLIGVDFISKLRDMVPPRIREWYHPASYTSAAHIPSSVLALASKVSADLIVVDGHILSTWVKDMNDRTLHEILGSALCPVMTL